MTYLGMQVLIEGLALAAFAHDPRPVDRTRSPPSVNAYVMQDEARHVAFGRFALRDYYPQLTRQGARRARGVRRRGLLPACATASRPRRCGRRSASRSTSAPRYMLESELHAAATARRSSRASCRRSRRSASGARASGSAYADMGILGFADVDAGALMANDEKVADDLEAALAAASRRTG